MRTIEKGIRSNGDVPMDSLTIIEIILRNRYDFFAEIRDRVGLTRKIIDMLLSSFVFLGIYGGVMGATHSLAQVGSSAIKLPILFVVTLVICTPSLYFFNLFFGSRQTITQNIALVLTAMTTTAVLLVSFAPVTLFFLLTTSQYDFFKLLNVAVFAISGSLGISFLRQGMRITNDADNPEGADTRRTVFALWVLLYAFVGSQLAWTLSPFIGEPDYEFILFKQFGGNFYSDVITSLARLFGFGS